MKRRTLIQFAVLQVLILAVSMSLPLQGLAQLVGNTVGVLLLYRLGEERTALRVAQIFLCLQALSGGVQFLLSIFFRVEDLSALALAYELCLSGQIVSFCIAMGEGRLLARILSAAVAIKAVSHTVTVAGYYLIHAGELGWNAVTPFYLCTMLFSLVVYILYPYYIYRCSKSQN